MSPDPGEPGRRYVGWLPAAALCVDGRTACATLVVTVENDSATARWPLAVSLEDMAFPTVVVLDDDTARSGTTDSLTPGRAVLAVDSDQDAAGLVAALTRRAPEGLSVVMVDQAPTRATVRIGWQPPAPPPTVPPTAAKPGTD